MITRDMVGPGGPEGCSVMNCLDRAIVQKVFEVAHPYQEKYNLRYRFCEEHKERGFNPPHQYPNFELISETSL